jgi:N-acyl-D-amino-acid deacylase
MRALGILCLVSAGFAATAPADRVREAAGRAVALIQASQKVWNGKESCYSCHHQSLPPLAFRAAREHGIPVDEAAERLNAERAYALFSDFNRAVQYTHVIDPALSESYLMIGGEAAGMRPNIVTAVYARLIAGRQKADGHWFTLDVRPPQSYSKVTATVIAMRAVQLYAHPSAAAGTKSRVERARSWLASQQANSTEERAMQLLGLKWTGADAASLATLGRVLKSTQQSDGGWSSRAGLKSDAYSTGEALVALEEAGGVAVNDAAWQRGLTFLLDTQAPDGSWHVVSRLHPPAPVSPPYVETGYPYGHDQFISIMAASWAIQALAVSLGPGRRIEVGPVESAKPKDVEPWVETALFGSLADLRALLDRGLDPNSATKSGGTTLLMLVQPDLEKTKLLVERGAKVNARAKTKYSALLVASQYPDSNATMKFLLDHGAEVSLPKGAGAPLFNASPMVLASLAGNAEIAPRLRQAGDNVDSRMLLLGNFPATPLLTAVFVRDAALTRALLNNGAAPDRPDDDGITPLAWAAIGAEPAIGRILIERGVDVNHVDRFGMTPLLYAASTDLGDSTMIELLLKNGANRNARTKEGLTAADLARKYGYEQLLKSLTAGL